jgi:rRNA maturation endonuclease Nob1
MLVCKGQCHLKYTTRKTVVHASEKGYKRCSKCLVFIKYEGVWCPCCGVKLKISPRNNKSRQVFREMKLENIL